MTFKISTVELGVNKYRYFMWWINEWPDSSWQDYEQWNEENFNAKRVTMTHCDGSKWRSDRCWRDIEGKLVLRFSEDCGRDDWPYYPEDLDEQYQSEEGCPVAEA